MGVESEAELAFAGLRQLVYPILDRLELLPGPQRRGSRTASEPGCDAARARASACREVSMDELHGPCPFSYGGGTTLG